MPLLPSPIYACALHHNQHNLGFADAVHRMTIAWACYTILLQSSCHATLLPNSAMLRIAAALRDFAVPCRSIALQYFASPLPVDDLP
jgi:hypothetical protein